MKKKLLLINPIESSVIGLNRYRATNFPPLSLAYVAALTPRDAWDIDIIDENFELFAFRGADLVGITSFTCNINRAYAIASEYKKTGIPVVMGGIHVSLLPDEALTFCDSVVIGDANGIWRKVLDDFENGMLKRTYNGGTMDLDSLVLPDTTILNKSYRWGTLLTSRGCPMKCDFCSVTKFCGAQYKQRPIESIVAEFKTIQQQNVLFLDDNILGYGPQAETRAVRLFKEIAALGLKKNIFCQASLNIADSPEVLQYAARAGVRLILIGFESVNEESLRGMRKSLNLKFGISSYRQKVRAIHRAGIGVWGCFILGNDNDGPDVFDRIYNAATECAIDVLQVSHSTPLPQTPLFERIQKEGRLLYGNFPFDWKYYTLTNIMYKPRHLSVKELQLGFYRIRTRYFNPVHSILRTIKTFACTRSLKTTLIAYLFNDSFRKKVKKKFQMEHTAALQAIH